MSSRTTRLMVAASCLALLVAVTRLQVIASAASPGSVPSVVLKDPEGRSVNPFLAAEQSRAIVFLFASVDCPVSNRYAPEVQRLNTAYASKGVAFWLVYPNPSDTPEAVREHLKAYNYPVHALLDPRHDLVKIAKVTITPEAAVFAADRTLAYHGRIDDRFVSLGVERPSASRHDLSDALAAVLAGQAPAESSAPAVGCFIVDFVQ